MTGVTLPPSTSILALQPLTDNQPVPSTSQRPNLVHQESTLQKYSGTQENRGRNLIAQSLDMQKQEQISRLLDVQTTPAELKIGEIRLDAEKEASPHQPEQAVHSTATGAKPAEIEMEKIAPPAAKAISTIVSFDRTTVFTATAQAGAQAAPPAAVKIAHIAHQGEAKGNLAQKVMTARLKNSGLGMDVSFQRNLKETEMAAPDLAKLKEMLRENDVVMLEANLGQPGGKKWPFPDDFFDDSTCKVIMFAGGNYPEINDRMEELQKRIGSRLLTPKPVMHAAVVPLMSKDFVLNKMLNTPPPEKKDATASPA